MDFKCKKCGGELIMETRTIGVCSYCKSRQTVSSMKEEKQADLFKRAEAFRQNGDFDQAVKLLESLVNSGQQDAELHWVLALCRYGVIYVEDPTSHKHMPTFYRLQKESFLSDPDYQAALELSGQEERAVYTEQAREISRIQQKINSYMSGKEKFDVFISYKETDQDGNRTRDSEIAHRIYNALTKEGIHVFFSHITLENMLGEDYEAVIYSALMSSKIMLLVLTSKEYAEAPWVKNEWKRYLSLAKQDDSRRLIPVLYGMKPEDIPNELAHLKLQALDFTKMGAQEDLVHNTRKILNLDKQPTAAAEDKVSGKEKQEEIDKLLRNAFLYLSRREYDQALLLSKEILVRDPEYARMHFCYFCAEKKLPVPYEEGLVEYYKREIAAAGQPSDSSKTFDSVVEAFSSYREDFHYQQAYKFGDREYKNKLDSIFSEIESMLLRRIDGMAAGAVSADDHYRVACLYGAFPENQNAIQKKNEHQKIKDSTDAKERYETLTGKAGEAVTFRDCMDLSEMLSHLKYRDSDARAAELRQRGCQIGYASAVRTADTARTDADHLQAAKIFQELAQYGYRDAARKMKSEQQKALEIRLKEAQQYAETHPTAEGYTTAVDMIRSLGLDEGQKEIEKYEKLAVKAASTRSGSFSKKENARRTASIIFSILAILFAGLLILLILNHSLDSAARKAFRTSQDQTIQFALIGLYALAIGLGYGFIVHFCRRKKLFCFLYIGIAALFPIYCALTGQLPFSMSAATSLNLRNSTDATPYVLGALMIPSLIGMLFVANARWQSMLKTIGWIAGLFVLVMFVMQVDFGPWKSQLRDSHAELSEAMQLAVFPVCALIGGLLFGFWRKLTRINRLMDVLYVAAVYSLVVYGPDFIWKTELVNNANIAPKLLLGILLIPSIVVFFIRKKH